MDQVQITAEQDLILEIDPDKVKQVEAIFDGYGINPYSPNKIFNRAVTCVALPACIKALAESERVGEESFQSVQDILDRHQIKHLAPTIRITGCPNGNHFKDICGRRTRGTASWKIRSIFRREPRRYPSSTKVADKLKLSEIYQRLDQKLALWAAEGQENEAFGDFVHIVSDTIDSPAPQGRKRKHERSGKGFGIALQAKPIALIQILKLAVAEFGKGLSLASSFG